MKIMGIARRALRRHCTVTHYTVGLCPKSAILIWAMNPINERRRPVLDGPASKPIHHVRLA